MSPAANERVQHRGSRRPRPRDWPPASALAAGIAALYPAAIVIAVFRHDSAAQDLVGYSVMTLAIVVAAIVSQRGLRPALSLLSRTRPGVRWACFILAGLALVSLSSDAWVHLFHPAAGDAAANSIAEQVRQHARGAPSPLTLGLWIALAGPVAEELLARGLLFNVLAQARKWAPRYSAAIVLSAAAISSLLFALWHGDAADTLPDRFAMAMILCGVYWFTGSLLPAIAVHVVWNLRWFQVAVLRSHAFLLGQWPALDLLLIAGALAAAVAVSAASRWNLARRWAPPV